MRYILGYLLLLLCEFAFSGSLDNIKKMILEEYKAQQNFNALWKTHLNLEYQEKFAKFEVSGTFYNKWIIQYSDTRKPLARINAHHISSIANPEEYVLQENKQPNGQIFFNNEAGFTVLTCEGMKKVDKKSA